MASEGMYPTWARISVRCRTQSMPITRAEPEVGERRPRRVRMVVLFPAPLGPMKP